MTATYSRFAHPHVWRTGLLRWDWEITDGLGGRVLDSGHAWTRVGADIESITAQIACEPSLALRLEQITDRLGREGIPVVARLDEQERVCVRPTCPCSDRDHRRVMKAFAAQVGPVRWEVR